ncbi:hypothetical protein KFE25_013157 [Diacronema lutheri]|uniref:Inositol hexakisphosphate and diphosphoinositol-pentakisphosphate kinase n=1 Tax=Diacronema lutheri TaxID=2081491 RepID=A0A8J6C372_DIALT|nr:hypothetical protein KFE25_013157 [Diacronema lutheri]
MERPITLGVCAMAKKACSAPMRLLLDELCAYTDEAGAREFVVVVFDERDIIDAPIESWPVVDALLAFFSAGFPLGKAIAYTQLRHPFCLNDLALQRTLLDRAAVYTRLRQFGVPVPPHALLDADARNDVEETDDAITINGVVLNRPFVEKPRDSEDHAVAIYWPRARGGGAAHLFRKNGADECAAFDAEARRSRAASGGSFLYEQWLPTSETDVKVYAVGREHAHAELRKAPACGEGRVQREAKGGREKRAIVQLSEWELEIARRVYDAFGQSVCGFDLLRASGGADGGGADGVTAYVCDVNGWSHVKGAASAEFAAKSASLLRAYMLGALASDYLATKVTGATCVGSTALFAPCGADAPSDACRARDEPGRCLDGEARAGASARAPMMAAASIVGMAAAGGCAAVTPLIVDSPALSA